LTTESRRSSWRAQRRVDSQGIESQGAPGPQDVGLRPREHPQPKGRDVVSADKNVTPSAPPDLVIQSTQLHWPSPLPHIRSDAYSRRVEICCVARAFVKQCDTERVVR
jgi:hypothetical protein